MNKHHIFLSELNIPSGAGDAALAEDPGLVPSTHIMAHNHPLFQLQWIQWSLLTSSGSRYTYGTKHNADKTAEYRK